MPSLHTPKRDISRWIGYPLVCLLLVAVLWRLREDRIEKQTNGLPACPKGAARDEYVGTWEEVVTAVPAVIRQLL
jgi:hypothetical protein